MDSQNDSGACPLGRADDRRGEAHFFLHQVLVNTHEPDEFRWNLNAFVQSLASLRDMLRLDLERVRLPPDDRRALDDRFHDDEVLRTYSLARNAVVHRDLLQSESSLEVGVWRWDGLHRYRRKLTVDYGFSNEPRPSVAILRALQGRTLLVPSSQSVMAIGEVSGIRRHWRLPALSDPDDQDVLERCHVAWARSSAILDSAHRLVGREASGQAPGDDPEEHDPVFFRVLTDVHLNPALLVEWDWETHIPRALLRHPLVRHYAWLAAQEPSNNT